MKKNFLVIVLAMATALFCQCSSNEPEVPEVPQYNEYVSAYTSGTLTRKSDVKVIFSQDIPQGRLDSVKAEEVMQLSPKVEGTFTFADAHTLVFSPKAEMKRNAKYTVKVKTNKLFADGKEFEYAFLTRPFSVGGGLKSFEVTNDDQYELTFNLMTADEEKPEVIEKHVTCSMEGGLTWTHASDGLNHQLKVRVNPTTACALTLTQESDKSIEAREQVITTIQLPSTKTFTVVSQRSRPGDTKCIEVTFNKNLDPKRSVQGLVYVRNKDLQASVEGNKVLLVGDMEEGETLEIIIDKNLTSLNNVKISPSASASVTITNNKPSVEFVGKGTIVPQSDRILIPFRSVYMKGIRVLVHKVFQNRIGSLLQEGDINSYYNFCYVARPVYATTFYIDDKGADLSDWHTYAIDLTDQFKMEPGAIYRVELGLDARLSAWPNDSLPKATREEIAEEDAKVLESAGNRFDQGCWYYIGQAFDTEHWDVDNYYQLRQDPGSVYYYDSGSTARNVLATNIGLTVLRGADDNISVTAINLLDAQPMSGVEVEVYSLQQQKIGEGKTDADGMATIAYNTHLGRPFYLQARKGNDVSYLKVSENSALSTSTFDVSGDVVQRGLKGYIYGERGVWRPGDVVHLSFMLNDRNHTLPQNHPVTLKLSNPLGQVTNRLTKTESAMGLYSFSIPTADDAPTGIWNVQISVGGATFNKNIRIEAIKPNRLKIDLKLPEGNMAVGANSASLQTEWLNGSKAGGLKYDVTAKVVAATTSFKDWKGYVFDDPTKVFETSEVEVSKGAVDASGHADLRLNFQAEKQAPGMLAANLVTHVYEPSGEFSVDGVRALVAPYRHFVGIKAPEQTRASHLDTDKFHSYALVTVDKDGNPVANTQVQVDVYKVRWYWWWNSSNEQLAGYTSSRYNEPVNTLHYVTDAMGQVDFNLKMDEADWGTYLIVATDKESGHSTGVMSYFDWPNMESRRSEKASENATSLSITTDKQEYHPGDKMRISVPSEQGSRAIVSISNGSKILSLQTYSCQKSRSEFVIDVTDEMMPNAYVAVSLIQPYEQTVNDMPIRMYGIVPVKVTSDKSHLVPHISCADEFLPETKVQVTVSEKDGRAMGYTLAIVDEGLLDLTRFKTPNAWPLFNVREALGVRFWDLYSNVNGAFGGRIEQMFSVGGDEALNNGPKAIVNRFTPMVHFSGPFTLKKGEKRTHTISVPNYNGRVRVMVVAGDGSAYGSAEKSVQVRKPLMLIATMPRQIGKGDEVTVSATVFATQALGDVKVDLSTSKGMQVVGEKSRSVSFREAGDKTVQFRVKEVDQASPATITLVATGSGQKSEYVTEVPIRKVCQTLSQTFVETVNPGSAWKQDLTLPGIENHKLLVDVSATQPLNMSSRLKSLIAYPHGCVEQTTSKAFPQLYLGEFSVLYEEQQKDIENNVKYCINRLANYQVADGGMSYWPGGKVSGAWISAYVLHFFHEASSRGYYVPDDMMRRLKNYVVQSASNWEAGKDHSFDGAYQLYVLSLIQSPALGAMNRMREHVSELSSSAVYFLSAAYAKSGRTDVARELLTSAEGQTAVYGYWHSTEVSRLLAENAVDDQKAVETEESVRKRLVSDNWMSTSNTSFSLIAMSEFYKSHKPGNGLKFAVGMDGKSSTDVSTEMYSWSKEMPLAEGKCNLSLQNKGDAPIYLTYTQQGDAVQSPVERSSNGLELSVVYTSDKDQSLNPSSIGQSTTFKACVTVRNASGKDLDNVAVTHIVPAGWEILSASPSGTISYQDLRDDRLLSYIDHLRQGESITIRLNLSATYAGQYYLPAITAEAMYDATTSGCTASGTAEVK